MLCIRINCIPRWGETELRTRGLTVCCQVRTLRLKKPLVVILSSLAVSLSFAAESDSPFVSPDTRPSEVLRREQDAARRSHSQKAEIAPIPVSARPGDSAVLPVGPSDFADEKKPDEKKVDPVPAPQPGPGPVAADRKTVKVKLDDCIEIAIQSNLGLKISRLNDRVSDINVRAAWADYYPEISAGVDHSNSRVMGRETGDGVTRVRGGVTQRTPWGTSLDFSVNESRSTGDTSSANGSAAFSVRQPLWKGFGTDVGLAGIRTARINRLISRDNLELDLQDLIFNVRRSYSSIIQQIQQREVDRSSVQSSRTFLDLTTAREAAGQVTKLDVFNADVQLRGRELNLITTERALQDAYDALKQIMDVDLEEVLEVEAPAIDFGEIKEPNVLKEIVTDENAGAVMLKIVRNGKIEEPQILFQATHYDEAVILKEALDNRLDLLVNRRGVALEKINTMLQKDGLGQQVDLVGSFSRENINRSFLESGNGDEANNWQVGVQFSMPWGKIRDRASYERALLDLQRSEIALKQARTTVQLDVRNITRRLREAEKSLLIEGKRVEQAKRSVEAAQISFDRGLKDSFDVIRAEDDLKNAKNQFIARRQSYDIQTAQLEATVGKPTGRIDLDGNTLGGLIDSKLPQGLKERGLPRAQPDAEPHPADDPWNHTKQYREDYKPNKKAPIILDEK